MRATSRILPIPAALAVLALHAGGVMGDTVREESVRDFDAAGVRQVQVENARGLVTVRAVSASRIHVSALKRVRGGIGSQTHDLADRVQVTADSRGGTLVIEVRYPLGHATHLNFWDLLRGAEPPRIEVQLTLEVPARLGLDVRTVSGDVNSTGLTGAESIETVSGDVRVTDAGGPLRVRTVSGDLELHRVAASSLHTTSGDLEAERVAGPFAIETTSGDVVLRDASDSARVVTTSGEVRVIGAGHGLTVRTRSGDVDLREVGGEVRVESASGDVTMGLVEALSGVEVSTASGDIALRLPRGRGCRLEVQTRGGEMSLRVPLRLELADRHRLVGRIAGSDGTTRVSLRTAGGDIGVQRGED